MWPIGGGTHFSLLPFRGWDALFTLSSSVLGLDQLHQSILNACQRHAETFERTNQESAVGHLKQALFPLAKHLKTLSDFRFFLTAAATFRPERYVFTVYYVLYRPKVDDISRHFLITLTPPLKFMFCVGRKQKAP